MEFNGVDTKSLGLFDTLNIPNLPTELDDNTPVGSEYALRESNITAEVPQRFSTTTFADIDSILADKVKPFCLDNRSDKIFLLFGQVGLGKTSSMAAAIHERKFRDMDAGLYFSIRFLMPRLRTCRSFSAKENEESFYRRLSTVSFLCLDEVGTCPVVAEEREFLATVLSARYDNMLPTFISTNLTPFEFKYLITGVDGKGMSQDEQKELCARLDKSNAMLNRIKSVAIPYTLTGESYRTRG